MSTEVKKQGEAASEADPINNLKAEFNRKFGNIEEQLKQSNAQLQQMLAGMKKPAEAAKPAKSDDAELEDLYYKNPVAYAQKIEERAEARIQEKLAKRDSETLAQQKAVQSLYKEFPELSNDEHDLTKTALKKYDEMAKEYGNTPAAMKAAVAEAALELGIKPKSKRPAEEDDFTLSGSGSGGERRRKSREPEVDPRVGEVARLMGVDPEKAIARAKKPRNWTKFE